MTGVQCPHCENITIDEEFCDTCGKLVGELKAEWHTQHNKWKEGSIPCDIVSVIHHPFSGGKLNNSNEIENPIYIENNDSEYFCYFPKGKKSLQSFLDDFETISFYLVNHIVHRIAEILISIQNNGKVLGMFDLSDFWIKDEIIDTMVYRPIRPFFNHNQVSQRENEFLDYCAPEIYSGEPITFASDVILIGMLITALLRGKTRGIQNLTELRYISHQLLLTSNNYPPILHSWVGISNQIHPSKRYTSVENQLYEYDNFIDALEKGIPNIKIAEYEAYGKTDDGIGKRESSKNSDDVNQDRYLIQIQNDKALLLVADGITNAKYGSGSTAAEIIKEVANEMWECHHEQIRTPKDVKAFFNTFLQEANYRIVHHSNSYALGDQKVTPSELMGSTCTMAIIIGNKAYTISVGDSRIYLWSSSHRLQLLHYDQNVRNDSLLAGIDWADVYHSENASNLTTYLGMADTSIRPFEPKLIDFTVKEVKLEKDDLLFLCSDGVTDYLYPIGHQNDLWKVDDVIDKVIHQSIFFGDINDGHSTLPTILDNIIELSNENGGGDNITAIAFQIIKYGSYEEE